MLRANPGHAPVHLLAQRKKSPATNFFPCMSHCPGFGINFTNLRRTLVRDNRIDGICPENPVPQTLNFSEFSVPPSLPSSPEAISKSWTRNFLGQSHWWKLSRKTRATTLVRRSRLAPSSSSPQAQAISTLHSARPALVRLFCLAPLAAK